MIFPCPFYPFEKENIYFCNFKKGTRNDCNATLTNEFSY